MAAVETASLPIPVKIVALGDAGCGKTTLLQAFVEQAARHGPTRPTLGVEVKLRTIGAGASTHGHRVALHCWDTAGQERFAPMTRDFYRGTCGVLLCYDVTRPATLDAAWRWLDQLRLSFDGQERCPPVVLVGCKADALRTRHAGQVSSASARVEAERAGLRAAYQVSAHEYLGVDECCMQLVTVAVEFALFRPLTNRELSAVAIGAATVSPPTDNGGCGC